MYDIIVNPIGGKGKSLKALKQVEKILSDHKQEYKIHNTERSGHATEIAAELTKNPASSSSSSAATAPSTRC